MSKLQGFVLSFLKQLADCSEGKRKSITLELCDRRKPHNADGYGILPHPCEITGSRLRRNYQPRQLCFPKTTKHGTSLRRISISTSLLQENFVTCYSYSSRNGELYIRSVNHQRSGNKTVLYDEKS